MGLYKRFRQFEEVAVSSSRFTSVPGVLGGFRSAIGTFTRYQTHQTRYREFQ